VTNYTPQEPIFVTPTFSGSPGDATRLSFAILQSLQSPYDQFVFGDDHPYKPPTRIRWPKGLGVTIPWNARYGEPGVYKMEPALRTLEPSCWHNWSWSPGIPLDDPAMPNWLPLIGYGNWVTPDQVIHFPPGVTVLMENEPNVGSQKPGSPYDRAKLVARSISSIREMGHALYGDKSGGFQFAHVGPNVPMNKYGLQWLNDYVGALRKNCGLPMGHHGIGLHAYGRANELAAQFEIFKQWRDEKMPGRKFYITEAGSRPGDPVSEHILTMKYLNTLMKKGVVECVMWFSAYPYEDKDGLVWGTELLNGNMQLTRLGRMWKGLQRV
jgi:hypothetical protein